MKQPNLTKNNSTIAEIEETLTAMHFIIFSILSMRFGDGTGSPSAENNQASYATQEIMVIVAKALTRQRTALIEQIEREVIGEDETEDWPQKNPVGRPRKGSGTYKTTSLTAVWRNELRAKQRAKLTALRKEV